MIMTSGISFARTSRPAPRSPTNLGGPVPRPAKVGWFSGRVGAVSGGFGDFLSTFREISMIFLSSSSICWKYFGPDSEHWTCWAKNWVRH